MGDSELNAIQQIYYGYRQLHKNFFQYLHGSFFIIILSRKWTSSIVDILLNFAHLYK